MHIQASEKYVKTSSMVIQKTPSSSSTSAHSYLASSVQQSDLSDHSPFHSVLPHGFLILQRRASAPYLSLTMATLIKAYAWPGTRPCILVFPSSLPSVPNAKT